MRAGQQWEVCEVCAGHRPWGSTAREPRLGDVTARLPGRDFRDFANEWDWLVQQRLTPLLSTLNGARAEVEAAGERGGGGHAARSASVVRRNRARAREIQSGAWGPSSHCGETPTSSQGRQSQDG